MKIKGKHIAQLDLFNPQPPKNEHFSKIASIAKKILNGIIF